ncbi:uncharacterized protein LOC101861519 [Aplysia californica]|uniref:Uncharacterized protein LOC101861519 n=1 Tax=Aplysia californica TaxID=6500 RepID=A0ABM0JUS9_APLCA|nr:uncharacterized protein LOC101861519 [Aplysia californica]
MTYFVATLCLLTVYKMARLEVSVFLISALALLVEADIVLQSKHHCGSYERPLEERILDTDELQVFSHSGAQYYAPNVDCIITIIGKTYHQWEVQLINLHIDGHKCEHYSPCCNDFLKIFNSYRADNARLFPSIPWQGFCGTSLPSRTSFTSTQNYITIQFNSDPKAESMGGFALNLRQYPRRNAGSEFHQNGYIGGWNDGTLNELQVDWSEQEVIPGDFKPGQDPTFDFDPNGIRCYECQGCKKEYFDNSDIGVTTRDGCFVCTKEWLQGHGEATRQCLSRSTFREKLLMYRDTSQGDEKVADFRECRTLIRGVSSTTYVTLCVCDTAGCNKGQGLRAGWLLPLFLSLCGSVIAKLWW